MRIPLPALVWDTTAAADPAAVRSGSRSFAAGEEQA